MLEQDYILRQIRMMTESIAQVVKLADYAGFVQAEEDLDDAYGRILPMDRELFEALDPRSLLPMLGGPERIDVIVELQTLQGDFAAGKGRPDEAQRCYRRALVFLEHVMEHLQVDAERHQKLREKLQALPD